MGLDMYLERVKMLSDDEKAEALKMTLDELREKYTIMEMDETERDLCSHILPYATMVRRSVEEISIPLVMKALGYPEDVRFCGSCYGGGRHVFWFRDKDDKKYELDLAKIDEKKLEDATVTNEYDYAVFKEIRQEAYWRKEYDLQGAIYDACSEEIRNCGYYPLTEEMKEAILSYPENGLSRCELENTDDSVVCYHEWY